MLSLCIQIRVISHLTFCKCLICNRFCEKTIFYECFLADIIVFIHHRWIENENSIGGVWFVTNYGIDPVIPFS